MTPKQEQRIRNKIFKIRKELAADKTRCGGFYDDSRGLRYVPPELFVRLKDYKGGLRYLRWFNRTFSDDMGYPIFLFEWTLILFKTNNLKEAGKKAFQTFFANNYLFYKFLEKEHFSIVKNENSNWQTIEIADSLKYINSDSELTDFAAWLETLLTSDKFYKFANKLIEIDSKLETEPVGKARTELVNKRYHLINEI